MGKIHDALKRAEEERAALGGIPGGPATPPDLTEIAPPRRNHARRAASAERVLEARRSRVVTSGFESGVAEEFRSLRARIQSLRRSRDLNSLVVTSALPGEGKTMTATNLALSFGLEREGLACLVDADLRAPGVHRALNEMPAAGLAEMLEADAKLEEALVLVPETRLSVLPVRALPSHPSELLGSRRMVELMAELHSRFATVIVDAPPILGLPDATALVDLCDATLLVVAADETPRQDIDSALQRIDASKIVGTVFNRFDSLNQTYAPYGGR